ncbi:unnamed protein product [Heterobilharzia americana]|nr:unnamed protein product [Heterobilharzia americana]
MPPRGTDIVGIAETGSGKTGAFLLPIIQHWIKSGQPVGFALILAPTRELAQQLANEVERLGQYKSDKMEFHLQVVRLVGGEDIVEQALKLAWRKHHFIVATPGRLVDHLKQSPNFAAHQLSNIRHLVLDEADRMLNMAFAEDIDTILDMYEKPILKSRKKRKKSLKTLLEKIADDNQQRNGFNNPKIAKKTTKSKYPHPQIYLYSATMTKDVVKLRRAALSSNAVFVSANDQNKKAEEKEDMKALEVTGESNEPTKSIHTNSIEMFKSSTLKIGFPAGLSHYCLPIRLADRPAILDWIVESGIQTNVLEKLGVLGGSGDISNRQRHIMIFCKRCYETVRVAEFLRERGHSTVALTGRMKQAERKESLNKFISGEVQVLVATDVASRGLDISHVDFVINYSVPLSEKTYRHRVGRTARAGQTGVALTLVTRDMAPVFLEVEASLLPYLPKSNGKDDNAVGILRWPIALPDLHGRNGMLVRRRLADVAWSRASKTIRAQIESQRHVDNDPIDLDLQMNEEMIEAYANSDDEQDEDDNNSKNNDDSGQDSSLSDDLLENEEKQYQPVRKMIKTSNNLQLKTSGEAGITAARRAWKCLIQLNKLQQKEKAYMEEVKRVNKSVGWGVTTTNKHKEEAEESENSDDSMEYINTMHDDEMANDQDDEDDEIVHYEQPIKMKYTKLQASKKANQAKQNKKRFG